MIRLLIRFALKLAREINGAVVGAFAVDVALIATNPPEPDVKMPIWHSFRSGWETAAAILLALVLAVVGFYINRWLTRLLR
jgi:hypothetical protein